MSLSNLHDDYSFPPPLEKPDRKDTIFVTMDPKWNKIATVLEGSQALRDAGEDFTPKFQGESSKGYQDRLKKTDLTNVLEDSINNAVAKPFSKPMTLNVGEKDDPQFNEWEKDIDLEGNSLNYFGAETFESHIAYGICWTLVDAPYTDKINITKLDEKQLALRPYAIRIIASQILSARRERVNGYYAITYFRYRVDDEEYDIKGEPVKVTRIHEISAAKSPSEDYPQGRVGYFRTYESRKGEKGFSIVRQGYYQFDEVTVVEHKTAKKSHKGNGYKPPFMDLCEKNIAHWNSTSDQTNNLTRSRFAVWSFKNMAPPRDEDGKPAEVTIGPDVVIYTDENAELSAVTLQTDGIEQGWIDLDRKVDEMKMMGLDPLVPKDGGALTATERAMDEVKSNSALTTWAERFAEDMDKVFSYMALWAGIKKSADVKIIINTKFGITDKELNEYRLFQGMQSMGQLSKKTLLEEGQRRQLFSTDFKPDEELKRINMETGDNMPSYDLNEIPPPEKTKSGANSVRGPRTA